jgi:selenocysteine-specific elongation factor
MQNGRKVAIQILEFFDRHGVTLRRGDQRRISAQRLELFGALPAAKPAAPTARSATDAGLRRAPVSAQAR